MTTDEACAIAIALQSLEQPQSSQNIEAWKLAMRRPDLEFDDLRALVKSDRV